MNFGLRLQDNVDTIQIAPLINIVFLALVFFMATSTYASLERDLDITLPTASSAEASDRLQGEIYINLRADGSIILNEREVNLDELQNVLDRVAKYFPGGSVIIRGDRQADLGQAIAILDRCKKAEIQNVSFATTQETAE